MDADRMRGKSPRPPAARPDVPGDPIGGSQSAGREGHATLAAGPLDGHEVIGRDGAFIIAERGSGRIAGAFYAESEPGWWRGHCRDRVRRLFLPGLEPPEVAARFLR